MGSVERERENGDKSKREKESESVCVRACVWFGAYLFCVFLCVRVTWWGFVKKARENKMEWIEGGEKKEKGSDAGEERRQETTEMRERGLSAPLVCFHSGPFPF